MARVYNFELGPQSCFTRYQGNNTSEVDMESAIFRFRQSYVHISAPLLLPTCWELLFTSFSSVITTAYTLHHELRKSTLPGSDFSSRPLLAFDPGHFSLILDPSPGFMLFSCIILGCSISSFAYRRQESDRYQTPIFVFAIAAASAVGFGLGVPANLIMLVWIPWAIFAAMLFSICVHGISGRCARRTEIVRCQIMVNEKSGGH